MSFDLKKWQRDHYLDRYGRGMKLKVYKVIAHFKGQQYKQIFFVEAYRADHARKKFKESKPYLIIDKVRLEK